MAYDTHLAERLARLIGLRPDMEEKKMFGGLAWLLNGNMCAGVWKDSLIIRIDRANSGIFKEPFVQPFDITGKPMKGLALVAGEGVEDDAALERYLRLAIAHVQTLPPK